MDWTKVLTSAVGFPTVVRVFLPGALAATLLRHFFGDFDPFDLLGLPDAEPIPRLISLLALWFILGVPIAALNSLFYEVFEGRRLWPRQLFDWFTALQQWRRNRLYRRAENSDNPRLRAELWSILRRYPLDDEGRPTASHPTLLGNILAGYEGYPLTRYGMDSVFFWPRLWMQVDAEKKKEIDRAWSFADSLLALAGVSFLAALSWLTLGLLGALVALARRLRVLQDPLEWLPSEIAGGGWDGPLTALKLLLLGFAFYRISLPFHRANGELFKSVFDLYRDKLEPMTQAGPHEKADWRRAWLYLQYSLIECSACGLTFDADSPRCSHCGALARSLSVAPAATRKRPTLRSTLR